MIVLLDDDDLDSFDDRSRLAALQSLISNRNIESAIALRGYQEQLEQQEFLYEFPEAAGMFDRMAAIETQAYRRAIGG